MKTENKISFYEKKKANRLHFQRKFEMKTKLKIAHVSIKFSYKYLFLIHG